MPTLFPITLSIGSVGCQQVSLQLNGALTLFHADDGNVVLHTSQAIGDLHADKRTTNNDDLLAIVANSLEDVLRVWQCSQQEDIAQVTFEAIKWQPPRGATSRQNQLRVFKVLPRLGRHLLAREVNTLDLAFDELDRSILVEVLLSPCRLGKIGQQRLRELCSVDRLVALFRDDCNFAGVASTAKAFDRTDSTGATESC